MAATPPESVSLALAKLDLPPESSFDEARAAHRELLQVWHPDRHMKNTRLQARATLKAQELNSAWDTVRTWHEQVRQGDADRSARQQAEEGRQAREAAERERRASAEREQQARAEAERRAEKERQDQLRREREHADRVRRAWEQTERERIARERAGTRSDTRAEGAQPLRTSTEGARTAGDGGGPSGSLRPALFLTLPPLAVAGAFVVYLSFHNLTVPESSVTSRPVALAGPSVSEPDEAADVAELTAPPETEVATPRAPDPVLPASIPDPAPSAAIDEDAVGIVRGEAPVHPSTTANDEPVDKWLGTKREGEIGSTEVVGSSGRSTDKLLRPVPAATASESISGPVSEFAKPPGMGQGPWFDPDQKSALTRYQWRLGRELRECIAETSPTTNCPTCTSAYVIAVGVSFSADSKVQTVPRAYSEYSPFRSCIERRFSAVPEHGLAGNHSFQVEASSR